MAKEHPIGRALFFCVKFLFFLTIIMWAWLMLMPYYGWLLMQAGGGLLINVLGVPLEPGCKVETHGLLNFTSTITLAMHGRLPSSQYAQIAANLAPFLALVLATGRLSWKRRLLSLLGGSLILVACHIAFIVHLGYQMHLSYLGESHEIVVDASQVAIQFMIMLPFLLWLIFAYWDKLGAYFAEDAKGDAPAAQG